MRKRIIPVLLVDHHRRLVKTIGFGPRTYVGDPFNVIRLFNEKEVDEICVLDIDASAQGGRPDLGFLRELASECFMPMAYGGGITAAQQCEELNRAGIEKFVLGRSAANTALVQDLARTFGSQATVACVDSRMRGWVKSSCSPSTATVPEPATTSSSSAPWPPICPCRRWPWAEPEKRYTLRRPCVPVRRLPPPAVPLSSLGGCEPCWSITPACFRWTP